MSTTQCGVSGDGYALIVDAIAIHVWCVWIIRDYPIEINL